MSGALRPRVVELVGPAGAGKSTVAEHLLADERVLGKPGLGRGRHAPLLARHALGAIATLLRRRALTRRTRIQQILAMAYVEALPRALERGAAGSRRIVVLDQGAVYFLSRPFARDERLRGWRGRLLAEWRPRLDVIAVLDAPDDVLLARIESRAKAHALKERPPELVARVLGDARAAYEDALMQLTADEGPVVLRFDTSAIPAEAIAAEVLGRAGAPKSPREATAAP